MRDAIAIGAMICGLVLLVTDEPAAWLCGIALMAVAAVLSNADEDPRAGDD